jgi:hypothetical protein
MLSERERESICSMERHKGVLVHRLCNAQTRSTDIEAPTSASLRAILRGSSSKNSSSLSSADSGKDQALSCTRVPSLKMQRTCLIVS